MAKVSKKDRKDLRIGRMFIYLWEDLTDPGKVKFGDHSVPPGTSFQDGYKQTGKYIRASLSRQKHKYDRGLIKTYGIWDASEYAKKHGRFYKHAKLDDFMRGKIGHHLQDDFHEIDGATAVVRIQKELRTVSNALQPAHLTLPQANELRTVLDLFLNGARVVLAELCARFGKTIWSGALAKELDVDLLVVATYVQTVTTSFLKDLGGFAQWAGYVHVDTSDEDYKEQIREAREAGKKVIAYLSLCNGTRRKERIRFLSKMSESKLLVIDEADFGAHREKQVAALLPFKKSNDTRILLMTGTNGDRASKLWSPDAMTSVVYPELLVAKRETAKKRGMTAPYTVKGIKYFKIDESRHLLYPDVKFFQADLSSAVQAALARDPNLDLNGKDNLPSWTKAVADPYVAQSFHVTMAQALFYGHHAPGLAIGGVFKKAIKGSAKQKGPSVSMLFFPGSTRNDAMDELEAIYQAALPTFDVVAVYGETTSNKKAEAKVKDAVEKAERASKNLLILSAGMAQRSFSIGQIDTVYLAYDSGDVGATIQKMSRALTPFDSTKVGRVVSLSFDPNRDDKFDAVLLQTAANLANKTGQSINATLKEVFDSIDLWSFGQRIVHINPDTYLKNVLDIRRITRVVGATADLTKLDAEQLLAVAEGRASYFRQARVEAAEKGKTFRPGAPKLKAKNGAKGDVSRKTVQMAREVITTVAENADILVLGTQSTSVMEAIEKIDKSKELKEAVEQKFGLSFDLLAYLFEDGVINVNMVDLAMRKVL